ncbi:MAG: SDR family NAD(P)-dependent oxidoreductase [Legionella sp.]|nr:SDR family NAD(P)-dependent oxidoreductase [Legionella sp.]
MATILIIGASQGLGLEWVRHYKHQGHTVMATCRNPSSAVELNELLCGVDDRIIQLDVTDTESVLSLKEQLAEAPDITIYNAGVKGYTKFPDNQMTLLNATFHSEGLSSREAGQNLAFQVNAHGFDKILFVLSDILLKKPKATVVYVTTGVAVTQLNTSGGYPFYRESKAAGDAFARNWDIELSKLSSLDSRPRVFSIVPGLVDTGMGAGVDGAAVPSVRIADMAKVIMHVKETGDTHGVWTYDGTKFTEYQLPDSMKEVNPHSYSNATILTNKGIYKTKSEGGPSANIDPLMVEYWNSKFL